MRVHMLSMFTVLPISCNFVGRANIFSNKVIKTDLRNKISDDWLNDLMVCYCEKRIFKSIPDDQIMIRFQKKKNRKGHLPPEYDVIS
uniref:Uncharacterized protein n=1 Tax=Aegilops tauschii subsp. strangulata TaxID=200361 RepID=A0A453Q170_AEGTS